MLVTNKNTSHFEQSRRQFITKTLAASALCLGCGKLLSSAYAEEKPDVSSAQHKFMENSGMSFQQVYDFAFKQFYIPNMKSIEKEIGKEKFIEILKIAGSEGGGQNGKNLAQSLDKNDMLSLASAQNNFEIYKHVLTGEIVEQTDKAYEMKIAECLWAKTFREADASEIGYAAICHGDYAFARAFNPKMKMIRTKTLMQGDDYCNHRFVMEA